LYNNINQFSKAVSLMPEDEKKQGLFIEDTFDLTTLKKETQLYASIIKDEIKAQVILKIYRVFIILVAFAVAYLLYNMANDFIQQREYNKYHLAG